MQVYKQAIQMKSTIEVNSCNQYQKVPIYSRTVYIYSLKFIKMLHTKVS